jgi:hypothetical protein
MGRARALDGPLAEAAAAVGGSSVSSSAWLPEPPSPPPPAVAQLVALQEAAAVLPPPDSQVERAQVREASKRLEAHASRLAESARPQIERWAELAATAGAMSAVSEGTNTRGGGQQSLFRAVDAAVRALEVYAELDEETAGRWAELGERRDALLGGARQRLGALADGATYAALASARAELARFEEEGYGAHLAEECEDVRRSVNMLVEGGRHRIRALLSGKRRGQKAKAGARRKRPAATGAAPQVSELARAVEELAPAAELLEEGPEGGVRGSGGGAASAPLGLYTALVERLRSTVEQVAAAMAEAEAHGNIAAVEACLGRHAEVECAAVPQLAAARAALVARAERLREGAAEALARAMAAAAAQAEAGGQLEAALDAARTYGEALARPRAAAEAALAGHVAAARARLEAAAAEDDPRAYGPLVAELEAACGGWLRPHTAPEVERCRRRRAKLLAQARRAMGALLERRARLPAPPRGDHLALLGSLSEASTLYEPAYAADCPDGLVQQLRATADSLIEEGRCALEATAAAATAGEGGNAAEPPSIAAMEEMLACFTGCPELTASSKLLQTRLEEAVAAVISHAVHTCSVGRDIHEIDAALGECARRGGAATASTLAQLRSHRDEVFRQLRQAVLDGVTSLPRAQDVSQLLAASACCADELKAERRTLQRRQAQLVKQEREELIRGKRSTDFLAVRRWLRCLGAPRQCPE